MRSEALQTAKIYRHLLKAVKKHVVNGKKEHSNAHFLQFVSSQFRNNRNLSEPVALQHQIKLARDYTFLLNNVHHHKELLFSYNIAVDRSDEVKRTWKIGCKCWSSASRGLSAIMTGALIFCL